MKRRAFVLLLDSFGIGESEDAADFGDTGSNTFAHIAQWCHDSRSTPLHIPTLNTLGLHAALVASCGHLGAGLPIIEKPEGAFGYAIEQSRGKDTPSGHWELMGLPVRFDWGYFSKPTNTFPQALLDAWCAQAKLDGVLGNCHASGTTIIAQLGEEHIRTHRPIVYASADSVFQVAAHEEHFGLSRLYEICEVARRLVDEYNIGRVIARPFIGTPGEFTRTTNRKDYATPPHDDTLFDLLFAHQREVIALGKTADIFSHRGITRVEKGGHLDSLCALTLQTLKDAPEGSLTFSNFVDFDSLYGHRRDIAGYANALETFDRWLHDFRQQLQPGDLVIITADHGCDPSFPGSDHTREHVPVLAFGPKITSGFIGARATFADVGQTLAAYLQVPALKEGESFLPLLLPEES